MNIGKLKEAVASYLGKAASTFVVGSGSYQPDLLLTALNNASKKAQRYHNFLVCQVYGQISVAPTTGGSLDDAVLAGTATPVDVHTVDTFYLNVDGNDLPIKSIDKRTLSAVSRERSYRYLGTVQDRYPSNSTVIRADFIGSFPYAYMEGRTVKLWPQQDETKTVRFDGYKWMPAYTASTDEDWFCKNGEDYLMWAAIVECNYKTGTFRTNQEGTLSPPEKLAAAALEDLIEHDKWMRYQSQTPEYR